VPWFVHDLLPGLIIAVAASILAPFMLDRYQASRDHLTDLLSTIRERLHRLQEVATDYWLSSGTRSDRVRVEAELQYLTSDITMLFAVVLPELMGSTEQKGVALLANMNDAVTGGDFGSPRRQPDPTRASRCSAAVLAILRTIATRRREQMKFRWWG
jgi:hypothetical protein